MPLYTHTRQRQPQREMFGCSDYSATRKTSLCGWKGMEWWCWHFEEDLQCRKAIPFTKTRFFLCHIGKSERHRACYRWHWNQSEWRWNGSSSSFPPFEEEGFVTVFFFSDMQHDFVDDVWSSLAVTGLMFSEFGETPGAVSTMDRGQVHLQMKMHNAGNGFICGGSLTGCKDNMTFMLSLLEGSDEHRFIDDSGVYNNPSLISILVELWPQLIFEQWTHDRR